MIMAELAGGEQKKVKKRSIFAKVQDLAGISDKTADLLNLSVKDEKPVFNSSESGTAPKVRIDARPTIPFIHHPMPLMAPNGSSANQPGSFLFDYGTFNLCQMVELAAVAQQQSARFHGALPPLSTPLQTSLMHPFFLSPIPSSCSASLNGSSIGSLPGGAVLMLSPRAGALSDARSPSSPPAARSANQEDSIANRRRSSIFASQSASDKVATAFQLPAHPPSTMSLLASGKSAGLQRQAPRFQCPDCNRSYSTFSGLSKHQQFHCTSQLKRQFSCKYCDKHYSSLGALKMHIRTHTLPCKCQICGKAFSRPWLLQGHLRTHTGEKPFRCGHCGRAFADRSNLRAHLQTHSEIKKYRCKTCQKTFSRMSLLTKHENNGCPGLLL